MAFPHMILASLVGLLVAVFGLVSGQVGLIGAIGLYVAAGWASIIAGLAAGLVARAFLRPGLILSDRRRHDIPVTLDRRQMERAP